MSVKRVHINGKQLEKLIAGNDVEEVFVCEDETLHGQFRVLCASNKDKIIYSLTTGHEQSIRKWKQLSNVASYLAGKGVFQFTVSLIKQLPSNKKLKEKLLTN